MKSRRTQAQFRSRRARAMRENLKRAGIWFFVIVFAVSILGVALVTVTR